MQILNALVALSGDRNNMILKAGLTPAEILLLQQLHGADAVMQIEPVGEVKREPFQEVERLRRLYPIQQKRVQEIWRDFPAGSFPVRIDMLSLNPALLKAAEASAPYVIDAALA